MVFKTDYRLVQVKSIAECSKEHSAILSTFIKLPDVTKAFVLSFLSGHFTQVLLLIVSLLLIIPDTFPCAQNTSKYPKPFMSSVR